MIKATCELIPADTRKFYTLRETLPGLRAALVETEGGVVCLALDIGDDIITLFSLDSGNCVQVSFNGSAKCYRLYEGKVKATLQNNPNAHQVKPISIITNAHN